MTCYGRKSTACTVAPWRGSAKDAPKEKKKVADLEDAFKLADTDKDGKLSLDEWMEALKSSGHNVSR